MRVISGNPISTLDNRSLRQRMTSTHDNLGLMVHSMGGRGPPLPEEEDSELGSPMLSWSSARAECLPRRTTRGARARLEKLRRPARRCPPAFGGTRRRAGARAGCGCSATSSVVPDGSGAFYHQPLPRLPPSAPSLELSEAAF